MITKGMTTLICGVAMVCLSIDRARANQFDEYEIVDLTHVLNEDFPFIPVPGVTFPFSKEPIATLEDAGVAANAWKIHEHIGTQIDAPSHFAAGAGPGSKRCTRII